MMVLFDVLQDRSVLVVLRAGSSSFVLLEKYLVIDVGLLDQAGNVGALLQQRLLLPKGPLLKALVLLLRRCELLLQLVISMEDRFDLLLEQLFGLLKGFEKCLAGLDDQ